MPLACRRLLGLALLSCSTSLLAQVSIPVTLLPTAEIADAVRGAAGQPLRFAVDHAVNQDLRHGIWDQPEPGIARWRLQLHSPGASSLSARLEQVRLPADAELWFHDTAQHQRQGPLRANADGRLWTPMVRAQDAILELRVPANARDDAHLLIASVQHGYRDPESEGPRVQGEGDAGVCNRDLDAVCAGEQWSQAARATVMLTIANSLSCTGTLVNNVLGDDQPLVLTAHHCGIHSDDDARSTIAYFGVQKAQCGDRAPAPRTRTIAGDRLLARVPQSDITLFTLKSRPDASYQAYYAGWNASTSAVPQSGATLHHPRADDKKISLYIAPARRENGIDIGNAPNDFQADVWAVQWSSGVTEYASSGAGLWNQHRQVVGVLSGGTASCLNAGGVDYFGRLDRAWTASTSSSGQLKVHLDPDDTGCRTLTGKEPGDAPTPACNAGDGGSGGKSSGGGALPLSLLILLGVACLRRRRRQIIGEGRWAL